MNKATLIDKKIMSMTIEEMRNALKEYMLQDALRGKMPISVEVWHNHRLGNCKNGWYDVIFMLEDGSEVKVGECKLNCVKVIALIILTSDEDTIFNRVFQMRSLLAAKLHNFKSIAKFYSQLL